LEFGAKQQNLAEIFPKSYQNHQKLLKMHSNSKQNSKILQKSFEILLKSLKNSQYLFKFKAKQQNVALRLLLV